jgi:hypothetical protein
MASKVAGARLPRDKAAATGKSRTQMAGFQADWSDISRNFTLRLPNPFIK